MKKIYQLIFLSLFACTLSASEPNAINSYAVGDISIKSLFETNEDFQTNYQK